MSDDNIEYQAYICPWCFNDHSNVMCKTNDVKERIEHLQRELEYLKSKLEEKEKLFLEAHTLLKERDAEIKRLNELCSRLD